MPVTEEHAIWIDDGRLSFLHNNDLVLLFVVDILGRSIFNNPLDHAVARGLDLGSTEGTKEAETPELLNMLILLLCRHQAEACHILVDFSNSRAVSDLCFFSGLIHNLNFFRTHIMLKIIIILFYLI